MPKDARRRTHTSTMSAGAGGAAGPRPGDQGCWATVSRSARI